MSIKRQQLLLKVYLYDNEWKKKLINLFREKVVGIVLGVLLCLSLVFLYNS